MRWMLAAVLLAGCGRIHFTGDALVDVAIVEEADDTMSVFPGNGDGSFRTRTSYAATR